MFNGSRCEVMNVSQYTSKCLCAFNIIAYLMSMKDPVGCPLLHSDLISVVA